MWDLEPRQKEFVYSPARYPLMYGGVGSGKTAGLCGRAHLLSVLFPGNRGLLARYTLGEANDTLLETWRKIVPAELYVIHPDRWGWQIVVQTPGTPSTILIRALDHPQKYESLEIGHFGISQANEQYLTRQIWNTLTSRLRHLLPDGREPFYTGYAEANSGSPWVIDLWGPERTHAMDGYQAIEVSMYDNAKNLPTSYIADQEQKPTWWKRWFVYPCWEPLGELAGDPVFKGYFDLQAHVAKDPIPAQVDWPIVRGWDLPGPFACVWFQVTREQRCVVLHELQAEHNEGLADFKTRALSQSEIKFPRARFADYADPAAWTKFPTDAKSCADILRPQVELHPGAQTLTDRLEAYRHWMSHTVKGVSAFLLDPSCRHLMWALENGYIWKMLAGHVLPEPRKNEHSHLVDALGHALAKVMKVPVAPPRPTVKIPQPSWHRR